MECAVEYNGYLYTTSSMSGNRISKEVALKNAMEMEEFLSSVKTWSDEELNILAEKRNKLGLVRDVKSLLYDVYYDLCYFGNMSKNEFMKKFNLSDKQIMQILI